MSDRINHLLRNPEELEQLRAHARRHAYPGGARVAAEAMLNLPDKPAEEGILSTAPRPFASAARTRW